METLKDHCHPRNKWFISCSLCVFFLLLIQGQATAQVANFTASTTSGCFPLTVNFTDASTGTINARSWAFGNGNVSNGNDTNPSATYTTPGTYTVTLTVTGTGGQTDIEVKTNYIVVHGYPTANFNFNKTEGCAPLDVQFTDLSTSGDGAIAEWEWVFGDGATSSSANPNHIYTVPDDISVSLKVKTIHGCEKTHLANSAITVKGPIVDFIPDNTPVCQLPAPIQFTNNSTGNAPLTYNWSFGDGGSSTTEDPSHIYNQPDTYTVRLTVQDQEGCVGSKEDMLDVGIEGGLDFTPIVSQSCVGQPITFTIQANSGISSYEWNFGNQTTSTDADPSVEYTQPGRYQIRLKAKLISNTCFSIVTKTIDIKASAIASFNYTPDCDFNVTFNNTTTGFSRLEWYVENTLHSTANSFTYAYGFPGAYKVQLIAFNNLNCKTVLQRDVIVPAPPSASFLPNQEQDCLAPSLSGCAPFTIQFINTSTSSSGFTSEWDFGDGTTSSATSPMYTYFIKGTYTVSLKIKNQQGCLSGTTTATVIVSDVTPVADFTISKAVACTREPIQFTDQSQNANFWCWDFGDGSVGTGQNPSHSYKTPGKYTVKLISKNGGCTNTRTIIDAIEIIDPFVDFTIDKPDCNNPYKIDLENLSNNYNTLQWDFGDGNTLNVDATTHTYQSVGNYNVKLTVTNLTTQCVSSFTVPVLIQQIEADFEMDTPRPCKEAPVSFIDKSTAAVQWQWAFGNNLISTDQNTSTSYKNAGTYQVTLIASDSDGCTDTKTAQVDVLGLIGKFDFDATSDCNQLSVQFIDKSTGTPAITGWQWDFGDGQTSTLANPPHTYQSLGKYPVTLTLTNNDGTCAFIKKDAINFSIPIPDFSLTKPGFCVNERINVRNKSFNGVAYEWDFSGRISNDIAPQTSYSSVGSYPVTLSVTDQYGCTRSVTKPNFIPVGKPVASFDVINKSGECPPFSTLFQDNSTGTIKKWQWNFGDGQNSVLPDPTNTYSRPGLFDVKLTVTDDWGCTDEIIKEDLIQVGGPYGDFSSDSDGSFCNNKAVAFTANTFNAITHRWDFGDGTVQDLKEMRTSHHYAKKGSFNVSLVLIDQKGCRTVADGSTRIVINDSTKIGIKSIPDCLFEGDVLKLQSEIEDADKITWLWKMNGLPIGTTSGLNFPLSEVGQQTVSLHVTNQHGCISSLTTSFPVQGQINFIPNVITPNNDGYNESLEIEDINKGVWNFYLYNRWGNPVYEHKNYTGNWRGDQLNTGVYYYLLENSSCKEKNYKGSLSIIR
jgi:gliding motility-associated-like protein